MANKTLDDFNWKPVIDPFQAPFAIPRVIKLAGVHCFTSLLARGSVNWKANLLSMSWKLQIKSRFSPVASGKKR